MLKISNLFLIVLFFLFEEHSFAVKFFSQGFQWFLKGVDLVFRVGLLISQYVFKIFDVLFSVVEPDSWLIVGVSQLDLLIFEFLKNHRIVVFHFAQFGIKKVPVRYFFLDELFNFIIFGDDRIFQKIDLLLKAFDLSFLSHHQFWYLVFMEMSQAFSDAIDFKMASLFNLDDFFFQGFVVFFQEVNVVLCSLFLFAAFGSNLLDLSVSIVQGISEFDILSFGFFQRVEMSSFECLQFFKIICFQLAFEHIDFFLVIGFIVADLSLQLFLFVLESQYLIVCFRGQPL